MPAFSSEAEKTDCGCRSVGECRHNLFSETAAFDKLVDSFAEQMKKKFRKKMLDGSQGWNDPDCAAGLQHSLEMHALREQGQEIDTAILAAMLWNLRTPLIPATAAASH
jgi:hypothetical protein